MTAPPFVVTPQVLAQVSAIERLVGRFEGLQAARPQPQLRKRNRVRTIQGSVAIEGNTLSLDQVTAVLDGKRVVGDRREVLEVQNAVRAYELAESLDAGKERDLLRAHGVLMKGLIPNAGRYRTSDVGVLKGSRVAHVAPPWRLAPKLVAQVLRWLARDDTPRLIAAVVAHYELLFIHPFQDGNGRLARLWQHVALLEVSPVFAFVPTESVIRERQAEYYRVLGRSDRSGDSTPFLEFGLRALADALDELLRALRPESKTPTDRLALAREALGRRWFTRADYLAVLKSVSTATASRDLQLGVGEGALEMTGERRMTRYRFSAKR